ncbi:3493_t:CDS:2 [Funneliformis caledonium]|uniref:3493_t:CDS:1 n=1 Tax=Funneliformis caledonium TaxID=1117310 RepID=A0A9N9FBY9_9GLOM|nr:3493_t:CDS:2 [Funneliformis caledonium]
MVKDIDLMSIGTVELDLALMNWRTYAEEYFLKHVITYRRIMLQINPSTHDNKMKQERHYIVERLDMARSNLRNMYREGSMVYETFDIEVDAMTQRLKQKRGDVKYFRNMLSKLIIKLKVFIEEVDKTQAAFIDAKIYFTENNQAVNDIAITHIDLLVFNELFVHVHEVVKNLTGMKRMLMSYDDNLLDLLLYKLYQDQPDIFDVTTSDLNYLKIAAEIYHDELAIYNQSFGFSFPKKQNEI